VLSLLQARQAVLVVARQGARVVVAARRDSLLQEIVNECKQLSGREALAIPTDVRNEQLVQNLA
jgi:NADP-dependent 3-hydroxy acid dehydrogenase YdfG